MTTSGGTCRPSCAPLSNSSMRTSSLRNIGTSCWITSAASSAPGTKRPGKFRPSPGGRGGRPLPPAHSLQVLSGEEAQVRIITLAGDAVSPDGLTDGAGVLLGV